MATKVEVFRSDAGKLFDKEHDACRDDLRHFIETTCGLNNGAANGAVSAIISNLDRIAAIVASLQLTAPPKETPGGSFSSDDI